MLCVVHVWYSVVCAPQVFLPGQDQQFELGSLVLQFALPLALTPYLLHTSDRLRVAHAHAATAQVKRIAETAQLASMRFPRVGWKHDHVIRDVLREAGLILAQEIRNNHECCVYDSHELVQVTLERVIPDKGQAEYKRPEMQRGCRGSCGGLGGGESETLLYPRKPR